MSNPFLGQIIMFGGNFAPRGWALCDGQLLPIAQYSALFSILGTTYGGDGRTTFALPDMRGRIAIHAGTGPGLSTYDQGPGGGHENVTLTINQMPSHHHNLNVFNGAGDTASPENALLAEAQGGDDFNNADDADATARANSISNTGNGQPFSVVQPWCCVQFIIALQGTFPSRN